MKLTSKQAKDLFNCHDGVGFIVVKKSDDTLSKLEFFVNGRDEVCIINDNLPANRINLNEWVIKPLI